MLLQQLCLPPNRIVENILEKPVPLPPLNFSYLIYHGLLFSQSMAERRLRFFLAMADLYLLEHFVAVLLL